MSLATATPPVMVHRTGQFMVATFGGKKAARASALQFAADHGGEIKHFVNPPQTSGEIGFQTIAQHPVRSEIYADGILVTRGHSAGMYTKDCAVTVLMDTRRYEGVLLHCSRAALSPTQHLMNRHYTIVTAGLAALTERGSKLDDITAWITASICKDCFTHDLKRDEALLTPFALNHPRAINLETGGLDIVNIIKTDLQRAGVTGEIRHDGLCTKEHPTLASKRGGDGTGTSNLVSLAIE